MTPRRFVPALGFGVIVALVLALYARTTAYGLFADDYQWLVGAHGFDLGRLLNLSERNHFYRPVVEIHFPVALALCGRSAACFHWLNIALHAAICLLTAGLAGAIARNRTTGFVAGVLLAVQPGPVEAVVWVSAVGELWATAFSVGSVWLYHRALITGSRASRLWLCVSFTGGLLSHESGVMQLPLLVLYAWLVPGASGSADTAGPASRPAMPLRQRLTMLVPCAVALAASAAVAVYINSRNYVVTEGLYAVGPHMFTNILAALVTFVVARRDTLSLVLVTVLTLGTVWWAPPRARFYALWMLVALLPFAGFRGGMSSRYLYLSAVGVSGLLAELTSSVRLAFARWPRAGHAAWLVLLLALAGRYSLFAVKNIRTWEHVSAPYAEFAARVQARHGSAPAGVRLEVPPPPAAVPAHMVRPLLQWTYDDMDVDPVIAER